MCDLACSRCCPLSKAHVGIPALERIVLAGRFPRVNNAAAKAGCVCILPRDLGPALLGKCIAMAVWSLSTLDLTVEIVILACVLSDKY